MLEVIGEVLEQVAASMEILVRYENVEKSQRELKEISDRIGCILSVPLVMEESKGEMAEALRNEYACLTIILTQMQLLVDHLESAVEKAKKQFKEADENKGVSLFQ